MLPPQLLQLGLLQLGLLARLSHLVDGGGKADLRLLQLELCEIEVVARAREGLAQSGGPGRQAGR